MSINDLSAVMAVDEESITESLYEVLDALVEAMPVLQTAHAPATSTHLEGVIDIMCSTPAHLTVRTDQATGFKLAEGWGLVGEDGPSEVDASDAMSEFTNLVGGSMKFLLSEESSLGLPEVVTFDSTVDEEPRSWVDVDHAVGHFRVEIRPVGS